MFKGFLFAFSLLFIAACGKPKVVKIGNNSQNPIVIDNSLKGNLSVGDMFRTSLEQSGYDMKNMCLQLVEDELKDKTKSLSLNVHKGACPASGRAAKETLSFSLYIEKVKNSLEHVDNYFLYDLKNVKGINHKILVGEMHYIAGSLNRFSLAELCQYGNSMPAPYSKMCELEKPSKDGFITGYKLK